MKKKMLLLSVSEATRRQRKFRKVTIERDNTLEVKIETGKVITPFPATTLPPRENSYIKVSKYDMY